MDCLVLLQYEERSLHLFLQHSCVTLMSFCWIVTELFGEVKQLSLAPPKPFKDYEVLVKELFLSQTLPSQELSA